MDWKDFRAAAQALGFAKAGLCDASRFDAQETQVKAQPPLAERRQLRFDPVMDDERTRSIAVLLYPYAPYRTESEGEVFVDSYYKASNAAYHAAAELERRAVAAGRFVRANVSYPAKEAAVRAGLGIIGKNSLLITEEYGSRVVIILFATDFEADCIPSNQERKECLNCGKCSAACPSGAIQDEGMIHPERCLRNFMMEGVATPAHLRSACGSGMIGCDVCQRVCPMQPRDRSDSAPDRFFLDEFMSDDPAVFSEAVRRLASVIGKNAARPQRVRAQAALLAGNSGNPSYLPVLSAWESLPFEAVQEHARWAISRIQKK